MKVKTMKQLKKEIVEHPENTIPEQMLKLWDRDNIEFHAEQLGIEIYTKETNRTTYERLIGYDFGSCVLVDIAMIGSRKQYIVKTHDGGETALNYKEFKEMISCCDYPKK